ncbi:Vacuolar protein sorting protein vps66, partial [Spiromyces aspiralis]
MAGLGALAVIDGANTAIGSLIPSPSIKYKWLRLTRAALYRLSLLLLGFYWIESKVVTLKKGRQATLSRQQQSSSGTMTTVRSGDIIIANHTSYLDILYLTFRCNPTFVQIDNATHYVRPMTPCPALRQAGLMPPALLPASEARPLSQITEELRATGAGPVVVFPENTTSNGKALLRSVPIFDNPENVDEESSYPSRLFSPTFT